MSAISTVYDQIRAQLAAKLPTMTEIPNAYSLEDNMSQFLENGWGVTIGDASPGIIDTYCLNSETREFTISVSKLVFNLDGTNNKMVQDSKNIMETIRTIRADFLAYDQLGIPDTIQKIDYLGSSGIQFVSSDKFNFYFATCSFAIEYSELVLDS